MTLMISEPVVLSPGCGCDMAMFIPTDCEAYAACSECGQEVSLTFDLERHMDEGEFLVWVNSRDAEGRDAGLVLAMFTEELDEEED